MIGDLAAASHDASSPLDSTRTKSTQPLASSSSHHHQSVDDISMSSGVASTISKLETTSETEPASTVDEVVIQPHSNLSLPAIRIHARPPPPISVPSLDNNAKVGPQNFEKIRILGAGATGRVYLVKSTVRGLCMYVYHSYSPRRLICFIDPIALTIDSMISQGLATEEFYAMKVVKKNELVKRNRVRAAHALSIGIAHAPLLTHVLYICRFSAS